MKKAAAAAKKNWLAYRLDDTGSNSSHKKLIQMIYQSSFIICTVLMTLPHVLHTQSDTASIKQFHNSWEVGEKKCGHTNVTL